MSKPSKRNPKRSELSEQPLDPRTLSLEEKERAFEDALTLIREAKKRLGIPPTGQ